MKNMGNFNLEIFNWFEKEKVYNNVIFYFNKCYLFFWLWECCRICFFFLCRWLMMWDLQIHSKAFLSKYWVIKKILIFHCVWKLLLLFPRNAEFLWHLRKEIFLIIMNTMEISFFHDKLWKFQVLLKKISIFG